MNTFSKVFYGLCTVLVLVMVLILSFGQEVNESIWRGEPSFKVLSDCEVTSYKNDEAPIGITQEYRYTLPEIPTYNGCLTFYIRKWIFI